MTYTSNRGTVLARLDEARRGGLVAAATVLQTAVKQGLRGGYKSGAFVTGNVVASVTRSEPLVTVSEGSITVGTNIPYALFWELGHQNTWTRKYERKEVWMPALSANAERMQGAYWRVVRRVLEGG